MLNIIIGIGIGAFMQHIWNAGKCADEMILNDRYSKRLSTIAKTTRELKTAHIALGRYDGELK